MYYSTLEQSLVIIGIVILIGYILWSDRRYTQLLSDFESLGDLLVTSVRWQYRQPKTIGYWASTTVEDHFDSTYTIDDEGALTLFDLPAHDQDLVGLPKL